MSACAKSEGRAGLTQPKKSAAEHDAFLRGYLMAVSTMLHQHDCPVTAEDALRELGEKEGVMNRLGLDEFDTKVLRPIFRNITRRDRYKRQQRAGLS